MKVNDLKLRTLYVARREDEDVQAHQIAKDLKEFVQIEGLTDVRRILRYDVTGLDEELTEEVIQNVFLTPPWDSVVADDVDDQAAYTLRIEPVPGQYDQRADSTEQLLRLLLPGKEIAVHCVEIDHFYGELSSAECDAIHSWLINSVEMREASAVPKAKTEHPEANEPIATVEGFCQADEFALHAIHQSLELTMSFADLLHTQDYYRKLTRDPVLTEIKVLDTYWSDHCRHTTFNTHIRDVRFTTEDNPVKQTHEQFLRDKATVQSGRRADKPLCLMELATQGTRYLQDIGAVDDLDLSEEINACSIKRPVIVDGEERDYLIMFKNETHNHPTEIEPFGGAATCLGGGIRDPLSGRAYVYQAMRLSGCGDPTVPYDQTLANKLPQRKITCTAARGYSSYGDQIGLSAGFVREIYHPGFVAKRMELGALVAAAPADQVVRQKPVAGDIVALVGGRTGRDGVGGATGSSRVQTVDAFEENSAEVQKGNALLEHNIQRLFRDPQISRLIKRCNDFGAGGVSVAIGELADGLKIELDRVPLKYPGLNGTEIAISESQERMAVVLDPADVPKFLRAAEAEGLEVTVVAEVTAEPKLVMYWQGQKIVDLDRSFLDTNGAVQNTSVSVEQVSLPQAETFDGQSFATNLKNCLGELNECSQAGLNELFDSLVGGENILAPLGGSYQQSPEMGMASYVAADGQAETATLMTYGYYPFMAEHSPYHAAYRAVLTSVLKLAAMGADPKTARLSFQEYFQRLETPADWGLPYAALLGAYRAQRDYRVPSIGGKDSMSGSYEDIKVPPTLISFAVTTAPAQDILSATFTRDDLYVYVCEEQVGSDDLPQVACMLAQLAYFDSLRQSGAVKHALVVENALATAVGKACFGNALGFEFESSLKQADLFRQRAGQLVFAVDQPLNQADCEANNLVLIGRTLNESRFTHNGETLAYGDARKAFESGLAEVFPRSELGSVPLITYGGCSDAAEETLTDQATKPRLLLPIFYGTTGEYELQRALVAAGAEVSSPVFRIGREDWTEASFAQLTDELSRADALVLAGGCTMGDQPEGPAKSLEIILRDQRVRPEIERLLSRQGRILGLGNGFQALVNTGLLPYGKYLPTAERKLAFRKNRNNDHLACLTDVSVQSDKGGWFDPDQVGRQYVSPLSALYWQLNLEAEEVAELRRNNQVAAVYDAADDCPEALVSPDGLVFGRMTHPERLTKGRAINLPGQRDDKFFERFVKNCCGNA